MAYRDDVETLLARIASLESELQRSQDEVQRLVGDDDVSVDGLPRKKWGWVRKVQVFGDGVREDSYEHIAQLIRRDERDIMEISMIGRVLMAKSSNVEVTLMPGEGGSLVLVVDRCPEALSFAWIVLAATVFAYTQTATTLGMFAGAATLTALWLVWRAFRRKDGRPERLFPNIVRVLDSRETSDGAPEVRIDLGEQEELSEVDALPSDSVSAPTDKF